MTDDHELQPPPLTPFLGESPGRAPETAYRTAHDLLARRAPREALEVLEPALEQEPRNTGLRSLRAWAYLLRAQLAKAEEELAALVEERPDDDWARHALGRSLERQARLSEALPHLRLAAAMSGDPEHELAVLRVERRLAETGQTSYDDLT
jgi:tetratricopeptide (TPR) repeat protein